jgi:hypothetical protein
MEKGAVDAEKAVRYSRTIDYAWLKDTEEMKAGREPRFFNELIDRQYNELLNG